MTLTDNEVKEVMLAVLERCRTCRYFGQGFAFGNTCGVWMWSGCNVPIGNGNACSLPRVAHVTTDPSLPCPHPNPRDLIELAARKAASWHPCRQYRKADSSD